MRCQNDSPSRIEALPGFGVQANVEGQIIGLGNVTLMEQKGIDLSSITEKVDQLARQGKTPMIFYREGKAMGIISAADLIKQHARQVVSTLKDQGLRVAMITGDHLQTAEAVARELKIDEVIAEVRPGEKAASVKALMAEGYVVAMVGDGINDAPALAQADIGIAIGTGTDIAVEASDITLIRGDLNGVVDAIELSRKTMNKIKQNLFWAFFYNLLGIPLAAGAFYPAFGWLLKPIYAAAAMSFSSVSVIGNSLLLKRFQPLGRKET